MTTEFTAVFFIVYIMLMGFVWLVGIASYVLNGISLQTIAKRRGIENSWLAWIPIGNVFILGAIADDYNQKVRAVKTSYRKIMLYFMIAMMAGLIALYPLLFTGIYTIMQTDGTGFGVAAIIILIALYIFILGVAITVSVFQYISVYRLFQSCSPKNATLFLILGLFISGALPITVFICRNKDEGMPAQTPQFTQGV